MRCPTCGTYHPSHYEHCVSCGQELFTEEKIDADDIDEAAPDALPQKGEVEGAVSVSSAAGRRRDKHHHTIERNKTGWQFDEPVSKRRSKNLSLSLKAGAPHAAGAVTALIILLVSAGATVFFLTKPAESDHLLSEGLKQLDNGQYAFAVDTLTKAEKNSKDNPRITLALARAYVGIDQVDKAWECIERAKGAGQGIAEDPELASQLANYYRLHTRYDKACDLLRPLASKNIPGKRAELADLDALWGDEELRNGNVEKALTLWEEVKDLKEGSRFSESDARLATIYQKLAEKYAADKKDQEALTYLAKLNAIADNPRNYEMAADIYERTGQLELAIDQLRKASKLSTRDDSVRRKLATLLTKRGKELLDSGDNETGYGYLQQAKSIDPANSVPTVTMKSVTVDISGGMPHIAGQVWNPTEEAINALTMKVEEVGESGNVLWSKETRVVDEFVPPLGSRDGKNVDIMGGASVRADGKTQFKVYFDGKLYNSYPIGKKVVEKIEKPVEKQTASPESKPQEAPPAVEQPKVETAPAPEVKPAKDSVEEKTMKDLE